MSEKRTTEKIVEDLLNQKKNEEEGKKNIASAIKPVVKEAKIKPKEAALKIKEKQYYDVRVECMLPATLTFRVLAEDPLQASELIRSMNPNNVKHRLVGRKDLKISIYDAGSSMLRWAKNLVGL
jgi:hypothetical protein